MANRPMQMSEKTRIRLNILREAPLDHWIALSHDESRMVAASFDMVDVVELSRAAGENDPVLIKTPPVWGELASAFELL